MTSSWMRRGNGRSASRSPWTWPISFFPYRYSVPPNRWLTAVTPGHAVTASRISSPASFMKMATSRQAALIPNAGPHGLSGQHLDDRPRVAALLQDPELAVRAGALGQDRIHVLDRLPRTQVVDHVVDELDQLDREVAHRHLGLLAEVDELAIDPVADRPPLVLGDQRRHVLAETQVSLAQLEELGADGLHQCRKTDRLLEPGRHVAHPELEGGKGRVRSQVPPDLLPVVDRPGLDQHLDVVLVLVERAEVRRNAGAGKVRPDHAPVGLQAGVASHPERARGAQREQVGQEVARLVQGLDPPLGVGDRHVDVEPEDNQRADDVLQLLFEHLVALVVGYLLLVPTRERMGAGAGYAQAGRPEQVGQRLAHLTELLARLVHVLADGRANLDHGLHHLALDLVAQPGRGRRKQGVDVRVKLTGGVDDLVLLLDADREKPVPAHAGPSTTKVGTTLPAPAVTLSKAAAETRVMNPPTRPLNRYGSRSTARSR